MPSEELLESVREGTWELLGIPSQIVRVNTSESFDYAKIPLAIRQPTAVTQGGSLMPSRPQVAFWDVGDTLLDGRPELDHYCKVFGEYGYDATQESILST